MASETRNPDADRRGMLQSMLERLRDETYVRIKELRREQEQDAEAVPVDELDAARSTADSELHAALIAREEERLRFIDEALSRLDSGKYGACLECHEPIPMERLIALPFAALCVDCQGQRNRARRTWGEGAMIPPYDQQWTLPEEMEEPQERQYRASGPEEELTVRFGEPFGPEEQSEPLGPPRKKRGRPRRPPGQGPAGGAES